MRASLNIKDGEDVNRILLLAIITILSTFLPSSAATKSVCQVHSSQKQTEGQTKPIPKATPTDPKPAANLEKPVAPDQGDTIRINSTLVAVPVSVTDASGKSVRNLAAGDFQLEEEGKSQQVVVLGEPGTTPVELALLFDISGSLNERFQFEQQAASRFLKEVLKPEDMASIFTIGFRAGLVQPRVANVNQVVASVLAIRPTNEATAFLDTVAEAAQYLAKTAAPGSRRVVVVISDGEDTLSEKYKLNDALKELQQADCLFYSINPGGPSIRLSRISRKGEQRMITLASKTGGVAFLPGSLDDLDKVFRQITAELQAQYLLGYYRTDEHTGGGFRRITVRVPKRPELRVRARQGYYAPKV